MISTPAAIAIAVFTYLPLVQTASITLTGDAAKDFGGFKDDGTVFTIVDNMFVDGPDVGVPPAVWLNASMAQISGWDIRRVFVNWDVDADALVFGIDCYGICGDADGNGDPSGTSPQLARVGGVDLPNLAKTETFAIALDFAVRPDDNTSAHVFDVIVGVPGGQPLGVENMTVPQLPCSRGFSGDQLLTLGRCAGVYDYQATDQAAFARRFLKETVLSNDTNQWWPFANAIANTSADAPDLEWTIYNITALRSRFASDSAATSWRFKLRAFAGSFEDAGIGEDYVPSATVVTTVELSIGESKTTTTAPSTSKFAPESSSEVSPTTAISTYYSASAENNNDDDSNSAHRRGGLAGGVAAALFTIWTFRFN